MVDHQRQPNVLPPGRQENSDDGTPGERVAKALARAGVASRREVERLIEGGRVAVNGKVLDTPAVKIAPGDILTVDGMVVASAEPTRLWRYHKPAGLMTTHNDPQGRPTVFEHLPEGLPRVISIGRLDLNTEGLLLLTNDGELSRSLELPATGLVRRYRARAFGHVTQARLDKLKDGVTIEGVAYGAIEARLDKAQGPDKEKGPANLWITLSLAEGKNREVRRVLEHLGLKVNRLIRLAYGPFALGTLEQGAVEEVGPRVIREQLVRHIAPENLPTGDRRPGPAMASTPSPGRRSSSSGPAQAGASPRAARPKEPEAVAEKLEYKPGWAKPKRKAHPHPAPSAAKQRPKARQSWGETSTYKPRKPGPGAPADRVIVGDRPAYGEARSNPRPGARTDEGKPGKPGKPIWAKAESGAAARSEKPGGSGPAERPAWAKSGGKARASTNPAGSRAMRKFDKTGAAPADPRGDKPRGPGFRSSGKPQGSKFDGPRPERAADKRPGGPSGSRPKPPAGRTYGLPQHGEAHERAPWEARTQPAKSAPSPVKPPRRGPPKPRKDR